MFFRKTHQPFFLRHFTWARLRTPTSEPSNEYPASRPQTPDRTDSPSTLAATFIGRGVVAHQSWVTPLVWHMSSGRRRRPMVSPRGAANGARSSATVADMLSHT